MEWVEERLEHQERLRLAGVEDAALGVALDWGSPVVLWRRFRGSDRETRELLPSMIAEWTLATIPEREPNVERARIYRVVVVKLPAVDGVQ